MKRTLPIAALLLLAACANDAGLGQRDSLSGAAAVNAMRDGTPQIAIQIDDAVLARDPDNVAALLNRGDAQTALRQTDAAVESYIDALQVDPHSALARIGLGRLRLAADPEAAEALFLEASQVDPSSAVAWNDLGIARDMLGHHLEAQAAYRQAIGLDPSMRGAQVNLALSVAKDSPADGVIPPLPAIIAMPAGPRYDQAAARPATSSSTETPQALALPPAGVRPETPAEAASSIPSPFAGPESATTATRPTATPPLVVLTATADAWMQVRDRSGQVLLSRTLHPGDTWAVPARPNLLLTTGNAGGTGILIDGAATGPLGSSGVVRRDIPLDAGILETEKFSPALRPVAIGSVGPPAAPPVAVSARSPSTPSRPEGVVASAAPAAPVLATAPDAGPAHGRKAGTAVSRASQPAVPPIGFAAPAPPGQPQTVASAMADARSSDDHGLLAAAVSPGMHALTVGVDGVTSNTGLIWPGDRVDLILTRGTPDPAAPLDAHIASAMVLSKVRVIGIDQPLPQEALPENGRKSARTVTFEVDHDQAERVAVAIGLGRLWLAARSADTADQAYGPPKAAPTRWASEALAVPRPAATSDANHVVHVFPGAADSKAFHF